MPGTWADYGKGQDPFDEEASIAATGRYLKDLQSMIAPFATTDRERIELTLAAYNAGPGNVLKFNGIPPFLETQNYVPTIMELAQVEFSEIARSQEGPRLAILARVNGLTHFRVDDLRLDMDHGLAPQEPNVTNTSPTTTASTSRPVAAHKSSPQPICRSRRPERTSAKANTSLDA